MQGKPKKWDGISLDRPVPAAPPQDDGQRAITNHDLARCLAQLREGRKFTFTRVPIGWASDQYHFRDPLDYLGTDGGGGLGSGPGMAVGVGARAARLRPHRDHDRSVTAISRRARPRSGPPRTIASRCCRSSPTTARTSTTRSTKARWPRSAGVRVENKWIGMRISRAECRSRGAGARTRGRSRGAGHEGGRAAPAHREGDRGRRGGTPVFPRCGGRARLRDLADGARERTWGVELGRTAAHQFVPSAQRDLARWYAGRERNLSW